MKIDEQQREHEKQLKPQIQTPTRFFHFTALEFFNAVEPVARSFVNSHQVVAIIAVVPALLVERLYNIVIIALSPIRGVTLRPAALSLLKVRQPVTIRFVYSLEITPTWTVGPDIITEMQS